ncbi:MAG: hypothetical protein IPJ65_22355 [Archangiaceae bacterium]|nr:hypothetical protein [Archangiaceae bacterium]
MTLLDAPASARVLDAVRAVQRSELEASAAFSRLDLMSGAVGLGLFGAAAAEVGADPTLAEAALARAFERFNALGAGPGLHDGLAGLGLFAQLTFDLSSALLPVDRRLTEVARSPGVLLSLRSGLAGLALYASTRLATESGAALAAAVVERLETLAVAHRGALTWPTPTAYAKGHGLTVLAEPVLEPGLAHGQAGVLVGLAALARGGVARARALLAPALDWLWQVERPGPSRFGWAMFGGGTDAPVQALYDLSWCTGDAGVARAAWLAAEVLAEPKQQARALALARAVAGEVLAGKSPGLAHRPDLCCGAAGVGHIFNLFFADTFEPPFAEAARRALGPLLERLPPLEAGSFQFGRLGVLAALIAATTDAAFAWELALGVRLLPAPGAG